MKGRLVRMHISQGTEIAKLNLLKLPNWFSGSYNAGKELDLGTLDQEPPLLSELSIQPIQVISNEVLILSSIR